MSARKKKPTKNNIKKKKKKKGDDLFMNGRRKMKYIWLGPDVNNTTQKI